MKDILSHHNMDYSIVDPTFINFVLFSRSYSLTTYVYQIFEFFPWAAANIFMFSMFIQVPMFIIFAKFSKP